MRRHFVGLLPLAPNFSLAPLLGLGLLLGLVVASPAAGQGMPVGFAEDWALAPDRTKVLAQLIPGTKDYYYYHCRQHQDTGAFDKVEPLLRAWTQRHRRTARVVEIENRQALLTFEATPAKTLAFLQQRLKLRFDHQRQTGAARQKLATVLDQSLVSPAAFTRRALQKHPRSVAGFRESAFEGLLASGLNDDLLMSLLSRLQRPDVTNLPAMVVRNLRHRRSRGFGSLTIHGRLLLAQLEECVRLRPRLLNERPFTEVYLRRLRPGADANWRRDAKVRAAYLDRLQAFAQRLAPAHNSLKAHVLYHRLRHDLAQGVPDKARLLAYLRLPRRGSYVNPQHLRRYRRGAEVVDLNRGYPTGLDRIGNDEPLVRAYLMHFFVSEDSFQPYTETVRSDYLRRLFAEAKMLVGKGDMERWYSMLNDPTYYQRLKDRVEINFAPTQREYYGVDEAVSLQVDVKNVKTLLVKVFDINTFNYYQKTKREVDASINLDGLVANHELTRKYSENPLRRVRRTFDLAALQKPGVYVVELIGNGISSRAVIHKGRLQYTQRMGAAGHVFAVRDEAGRHLRKASIWFGGRTYTADESGKVVLPYSTAPAKRPLILQHGELSSLEHFDHSAENYRLRAGIHLDRESLLARGRANILIRPALWLNGRTVSLEVLEEPVLTIRSRDRDGVESVLEVRDFKLFADRESVHEVHVPEGLAMLSVALRGRVRSLSRGKTVDLATTTETFKVNTIDATPLTACPLLGRTTKGYVLDVLGKNGEAKANRPVRLSIRHKDYTDVFTVTLKTDVRGRIHLGRLAGIVTVQASGLPKTVGFWTLRSQGRTYPTAVHGIAGETLRVPYSGTAQETSRSVVSLLEQRDGWFVRDMFDHVALVDGFIELRKLPPGDYNLRLKEARKDIPVRITAGARAEGWALGRHRLLQATDRTPLHIAGLSTKGEDLRVQLANAGRRTRVHVVATRYLAPFDPLERLAGPASGVVAVTVVHPESTFHSGREIGDEYRYILDRRFAKKYPGNMLQRPGLILNRWALDEDANTAIGLGGGAGGQWGGRRGGRRGVARAAPGSPSSRSGTAPGTFANLEFLPAPAVVVANLRADANGVVSVPLKRLGGGQLLHVLAVDSQDTVYASLVRPEQALEARSRQLARALDGKRHFAEQRRIEFIAAGGEAVLADAATARAETYDSLAAVYRLFSTLSGNQDLARFAFLLRWPKLTPAQKHELYEKHACHELHFFVHEKDPAFFKQVVRPYLANKAHKTFLDHWMLGNDLSAFVEPWAFSRLNIVERILLARRLDGRAESVQRHVRELLDLQPPDPARLARLFDSALKSGALDEAGVLTGKLAEVRKNLDRAPKRSERKSRRARGRAPRPGAPSKKGKAQAGRAAEKAADKDATEELVEEEEVEDEPTADPQVPADQDDELRADLKRRQDVRELYRAPDPTRPYVEHNYWHRRAREHLADLIQVNGFWRDFAMASAKQPFFSKHVAEATSNFAEMILALAVLDLPFEPGKHITKADGPRLSLRAASPLLLVRKELVQTAGAEAVATPILVSQNYYRLDEPYRFEDNQRFDAYITGEFLVDVAYGCRVVVTNPSSTPCKLDLLLQIPQGAIPVKVGFYTKGVRVLLDAYATSSINYAFYFPAAGAVPHYPVHVAREGKLVAFAKPGSLNVVAEPSRIDRTSWQHISQNGTSEDVLRYLNGTNLQRVDLNKIAWRMHDHDMFAKVIDLLRRRHVYADVLWSYGIRHRKPVVAIQEYLRHQDRFLTQCGRALESPLVHVDPIERHRYQHIEYEPLFNARAHQFGKRRTILNRHLATQYQAFLRVLGDRRQLDDIDWMSVTYYMLLQDRTQQALATFARVRPENLPMRVQYDYMRAYLDFFTDGYDVARRIAGRYRDYPVLRWRKLFADVHNQIAEAEGEGVAKGDRDDRTQRQTELAAKEAALELKVEARKIGLRYRNLKGCEVRYYEMDVEFLFSTHPFVQQGAGSFAYIRPNHTETRTLPAGKAELSFDLPKQFENSNVLIEVRAGGVTRRQAYYANSLAVRWIENYGQLEVAHDSTGKPLRTVYVKVFARLPGGRVRFHKDGYTDLRGRFDYASLSAKNSQRADRYSILVLSEDHGAVIREVTPPAQ